MKLTAIAAAVKYAFRPVTIVQHSPEVLRHVLPKSFDFGGLKFEPGDEVSVGIQGRFYKFKVPGAEDVRILLTKRAVDHLHAELKAVGRT